MSNRIFILFVTLLLSFSTKAQVTISGKVSDKNGETMPGTSIFLKGTYDGTTSMANGIFSFKTMKKGKFFLTASFVGYEPFEKELLIANENLTVNIVLVEKATELNTAVITAGSFEASNSKKAVVLKPLDIVTTAGAGGDINGALKTLPGAQQVNNEEGLFVRGGSAGETKTIIDEMVVSNPYFSTVPDVPARGRFSPFLFKGTVFSTGGYSAQYGQALSSNVVLNTDDLAEGNNTGISLLAVGAGASKTKRWKNTSASVEGSYANLKPFFWLNGQTNTWSKVPESFNGAFIFRHKTSETGILKVYSTYSQGKSGVTFPDLNDSTKQGFFKIGNKNLYTNASYKESVFEKLILFAGVSYSKSDDDISLTYFNLNRKNELAQTKVFATWYVKPKIDIKFGGEVQSQNYLDSFTKGTDSFSFLIPSHALKDLYSATFVETNFNLSRKVAVRIGGREEYSTALKEFNFAPRTSLAIKTGKLSQVSFAYGSFFQTPPKDVFYKAEDYENFYQTKQNNGYEKATHYIANYQILNDEHTFRVEAYYKKYNALALYKDSSVSTNGNGYAQGFDFFWRDKKTFKNVDYWVSYSYLDTKRQYRYFPTLATPTYAAKHTVTLVYKQWFSPIKTTFGTTISYASGRPYFNPNKNTSTTFLKDYLKPYFDLSVNGSYLTSIRGNFTVIFLSLSNVLSTKNVYGYRYSSDGKSRVEITPASYRTFFIGMFISIDPKTKSKSTEK